MADGAGLSGWPPKEAKWGNRSSKQDDFDALGMPEARTSMSVIDLPMRATGFASPQLGCGAGKVAVDSVAELH
jgi:hypothetical protein